MFQSLDSRSPLNKTPSQQLESIRYFRRDQDKRKRVPFCSSETTGDLPLPASRLLTTLIFPAVPSVRTLLPSTGPGTSFPFAVTPTRAFSLLSGWLRSHLLRENFWVTLLTCAPPSPSLPHYVISATSCPSKIPKGSIRHWFLPGYVVYLN